MNDCIFCKIVSGEIPSVKIYEDEATLAFLDISPLNPGHTLVIPKEHHENIFDVSDESLAPVMRTAKKVANAIKNAVNADAINIGINNGKEAGQLVFHLHIHVIPRFAGDGYVSWTRPKDLPLPDSKELGEKIQNALI